MVIPQVIPRALELPSEPPWNIPGDSRSDSWGLTGLVVPTRLLHMLFTRSDKHVELPSESPWNIPGDSRGVSRGLTSLVVATRLLSMLFIRLDKHAE